MATETVKAEGLPARDAPLSEGARPRLIIHQLVTQHFKSYAEVQTIGPFHENFSAIVGPNGSGKSNVIDALLFVFGKRAKQIRMSKVSELIHKSDEHQDYTFAKVDVHFKDVLDGEDGQKPKMVEGSEFVVSRVANIDNSSKYMVDGKTKTRGEVEELLMSKGIDLENNRFLILQGEVEQIATMKPKGATEHDTGLLEYLEEVIGSNSFAEPIAEKGKQVEELNEERALKLNRVKAVEGERENLEGAKAEAEDFLTKELQICQKQKVSYMLARRDVVTKKLEQEAGLEQLQAKHKEEQEKLSTHGQRLEEAEATYNERHKEHSTIAKELGQKKAEFASYERKDVKYREDIKHTKEQEKKLKSTVAKEEAKAKKAESDTAEYEALLEQSEKQVEQSTSAVETEQAKVDEMWAGLQNETGALRSALEAKKEELAPYKQESDQCRSQVEILTAEHDLILNSQNSGRKQLEDAEEALRKTSKKREQRKADISDGQAEVAKLKKQEKALIEEEGLLKEEEREVGDKLRAQRSNVQESRLASEELQSRGGVLQALVAKKSSGLPGVEDRLGNLGTIDDKYDVAISTACAGPLNHIVTSDTRTAEACVAYLKKNNLGRATFIMLDKLHYLQDAMRPIETPEGAPRLFDLVKPKHERFLPAYYMAMRDTLVAKDLEQASRLAYGSGKRFRVVTLQGQLIEASGTMSGGGKSVASGGMSKSTGDAVSKSDLAKMESELAALEDRFKTIRSRKQQITAEMRATSKALSSAELSIKKAEMEVKALGVQIKEQEALLPELREAAQAAPSEDQTGVLEKLAADITKANQVLEKAEGPTKKLEAQIADIQQQIANVGGKRLENQKKALEKATAKLDEASSTVTKCKVQLTSAAKNKTKAEKAAAKAKTELESAVERGQKLRTEFKELEEAAFNVMEKYQAAQKLLDGKTAEVQGAQKEYDALKKELNAARAVEIDLANQMEDKSKLVRDYKAREAAWNQKLESVESKFAQLAEDTPDMAEKVSMDVMEEELGTYDAEDVKREITRLEEALGSLKPNMGAIAEYRRREKEYMERVSELDAITEKRDGGRREHEDLRKQRLDMFMNGFNKITMKLKEMYQMVTLGGDAELELVDTLDPFSEGIVFSVRPPKKSWKNISNLSGGEKTLSSLALVFALHHFKPTPLYFMDEIDAALDFKNVSIVAHYIKERTKNAQFIIISLRNNMFELADRLVGIYKTHNATKSVTIDPCTFSMVDVR